MKDFKTLSFWKESHQLALEIYQVTISFPKNEIYGLTSQLRRASLSVPTNIAEGCGRESVREFRRFLVISSGSIVEVEYLLLFCFELELLTENKYLDLSKKAISIKKKLTSYKKKLPLKYQ